MKTLLLVIGTILLTFMPEKETTLRIKGEPVIVTATRDSNQEKQIQNTDNNIDSSSLVDSTRLSMKIKK